jgi:hypothetical protein
MLLLCLVTVGLTGCGLSGIFLTDPASPQVVWQDVLAYVYVWPQDFVEVKNKNYSPYRAVGVEVSIWDPSVGTYVVQCQGTVANDTTEDFECKCKVGDSARVELEISKKAYDTVFALRAIDVGQ